MNLRLLILFLGTCSSHLTLATAAPSVTYDLSEGTLKNVRATNARNISLSNLGINHLDVNSLNALERVGLLDLSNNHLSYLPPKFFSTFTNLRELLLSNNRFSSFSSAHVGLTNLEYLDLSGNNILTLNRGDLYGITKSGKVMIGRQLGEISSGIFKDPSVPVVTKNEETASKRDHGIWHANYYGPYRICISVNGILESINIDERHYEGICTSPFQTPESHRRININNIPIALSMSDRNMTEVKDGAFGKLSLDYLDLGRNQLRSTGFAKTLPKTIRQLHLYDNPISEVPLDSFYGLRNLTDLLMMYMEVRHIEPGTFRDQENLSLLRLDHNKISVLEPGFFQGLNNVEEIYLDHNQITKIPSNLFKGCNHPSPKLSLFLGDNSIKIIENGAFSSMRLKELHLSDNPLDDDSIQQGAFGGSVISKFKLDSNTLTRFNGEWFNGVSGLKDIFLSSNSVQRLEKGFAKHMKDVTHIHLGILQVQVLQNGALFGLSTENEVKITFWIKNLQIIEGGLFDDL